MLEHIFVRRSVIARLQRSPLGSYLDPLTTSLYHEGYAPSSIQRGSCWIPRSWICRCCPTQLLSRFPP